MQQQPPNMTDHTPKSPFNSSKPTLLQVVPELISGGVERGTVEIAAAAVRAGFKSIVVSSGGPMVGQLYAAGASHIVLPLKSKNPLTIIRNAYRLRDIIKEQKVDIVHARSRAPAWSAYLATRNAPHCHYITTFHGIYGLDNNLKRCYNSVMTKGDRVISISEFVTQHIHDHYHVETDKLRLVHRGVDLDYFDPQNVHPQRIVQLASRLNIDEQHPVILLPGRITRWKGHHYVLDALNTLPHRNFTCLFVGEDKKHPNYRKELITKIQQYGLESNVKLVGTLSDMPAVYSLADIVLSASVAPEAFGRVAIEAQAMGRLLIATSHGGSQETVIPGKTGWLVEPGDVNALATAMQEALSLSKEEREQRSRETIQHIRDNFSLSTMCNKTLTIYNEMLERA